jgi:hypothetical protein
MSPEIKEMVEALKNEKVSYYQASVVVNSINELSADEKTSILREFIPADEPPPEPPAGTPPRAAADFSFIPTDEPPPGRPPQRKRPMLPSWRLATLAAVSLLLIGAGWLARGWYPPRPAATTIRQEEGLPTIVGRWAWGEGQVVEFRKDGGFVSNQSTSGKWKCLDTKARKFQIVWQDGTNESMQLSSDGATLVVKGKKGKTWTADRVSE